MNNFEINIDRIILNDFELSTLRSEYFGSILKTELQRLLEQEGIIYNIDSGHFSQLDTSPIYSNEPENEMHLASSIAQRIAQVLKKLG